MNRVFKKVIILISAAVATVCLGMAVACVDKVENNNISVTLISDSGESKEFQTLAGDPLPTVETEDREFVGYWTDSDYTQSYTETTVPDTDITLYYKLEYIYYNLTVVYGEGRTQDIGQVARGNDVTLPKVLPLKGQELAGFATEPGGEVVFPADKPIKNAGEKGESVTLYAVWTSPSDSDFKIEDGVVVEYNGNASSVTLPSTATSLAAGAFKGNTASAAITSLTIPDSYVSLECGSLEGLTSLESLTVPFIGGSATKNRFIAYLFGAEKYTDNTYSFSMYSDGTSFYIGNADTDSLLIPQTLRTVRVTESVRDIAEGAFYSMYSLENLVLDYPQDLTKIGDYAFANCYNFGLDNTLGVTICPEWLSYVRTIGEGAFKSYTGDTESDVKSITTESGTIAELVDYEMPLNNFSAIPELTNIETIGDDAFYYCSLISNITFGENLKSIGDQAFLYTFSLKTLRFPDSLEKLGSFAFSGTGASVVEFGTGIRSIGGMAFAQSSSLIDVTFSGSNVPLLSGGQPFSNDVEDTINDTWNIVLQEGFSINVPKGSEEKFLSAPDWAEYVAYINPDETGLDNVYWSDGEKWGATFDFVSDYAVVVTDPVLSFISTVAGDSSFAETCGTEYPLRYELLTAEKYAQLSGETVSLYANQQIIHLWHPELVSQYGTQIELYFVISDLPYASGNSRVLVPVLQTPEFAGVTLGSENEGYTVSFDKLGLFTLSQIADGKKVSVAAPNGTYYSDIQVNIPGVSYTILYYNDNFEVIGSLNLVSADYTGSDSAAVLTEAKEGASFLIIDSAYNGGNELYLRGDGTAYMIIDDNGFKEYTATVAESASAKFGDENYTVTFTSFKDAEGKAVEGLTGKAVLSGFNGETYTRADITVGDFTYMLVNAEDSVQIYNNIDGDISVVIPQKPVVGTSDSWRYRKLSDPEVLASVELYTCGSLSYYRLYEDGVLVDYGTAQLAANGALTLKANLGTADVSGTIGEDGLTMGGKLYVPYAKDEDITIVQISQSMFGSEYVFTIKADGYGNMFIRVEEWSTTYPNNNIYYLGTYTEGDPAVIGGVEYKMLVFTGKVHIDSEVQETADTLWIIYDATNISLRGSSSDSPFVAQLLGVYSPTEASQVVVTDEYGCKVFEINIDIYENVTYTQYTYTVDKDGNVEYTALEQGNVSYFIPVYGEDNSISYFVAVGSDGRVMFSVRPSDNSSSDDEEETAPSEFTIVYDGGQLVTYEDKALTVDVSSLETLNGSGATFGNV